MLLKLGSDGLCENKHSNESFNVSTATDITMAYKQTTASAMSQQYVGNYAVSFNASYAPGFKNGYALLVVQVVMVIEHLLVFHRTQMGLMPKHELQDYTET